MLWSCLTSSETTAAGPAVGGRGGEADMMMRCCQPGRRPVRVVRRPEEHRRCQRSGYRAGGKNIHAVRHFPTETSPSASPACTNSRTAIAPGRDEHSPRHIPSGFGRKTTASRGTSIQRRFVQSPARPRSKGNCKPWDAPQPQRTRPARRAACQHGPARSELTRAITGAEALGRPLPSPPRAVPNPPRASGPRAAARRAPPYSRTASRSRAHAPVRAHRAPPLSPRVLQLAHAAAE